MSDSRTYPPMSLGEFAARWNVSVRTVRRWIRPFQDDLGPVNGKLFTPKQVKIILDHLE